MTSSITPDIRPRRATVSDVARAASVSAATVDRVLNQRHPVRGDTAARVLAAAERLGYHAAPLIAQRLRDEVPARTFGFLLQKRGDAFYQEFAAELVRATRENTAMRGRAVLEFADELTPAAVLRAMGSLGPRVEALGVVAVDHPHVAHGVAALRDRGVPTFAMLSDLTAETRAGYAGVDDRKAGRTVAWFTRRAARTDGPVAVLVGSHRYLGHELREMGFRAYFREHEPERRVLDTLVNLEDPRIAHEAALDLLRRHPDLAGIYVGGGGMEGVIRALREEVAPGTVAMVCHELTPDNRAGLIDGFVTAVIATPLPQLARRVVDLMRAAIPVAGPPAPASAVLGFELYVAENV